MAVHMRGAVSEIVCLYQRVALLRAWTLHSITGDRLQLTADIESLDAHRVKQQPLTFVVQRPPGKKPWRWPIQELHIAGDPKLAKTLTATLGPQE